MSAQAESPTLEVVAGAGAIVRWWRATDRALAWAGERLNPILVKETRQALKSKQFMITFGLLLICGWVWSILGVAIEGPGVGHGVAGPTMFMGYYSILAFPLMVIVPFSAFRSLAGEQEDRTYELMSITTLGPRQIVRGKLGSSVMQMLIYLSAISPCLAFTYMLRGVDFPTILFIVLYSFLGSLGLSVIGLFLGTLTSEKHWQIVLSVVWIAGLLYAFGISIAGTGELIFRPGNINVLDVEFWQVNAAILTGYLAYFLLIFYAAASRITFSTDNRSTRLRVVMLLQFALATGWMTWIWVGMASGDHDVLLVYLTMVGVHWYVMGTFMTGESPELSPRVKRRLPQSFLGRGFLTWFNPGPGTGYMFATVNLASAVLLVLITIVIVGSFQHPFLTRWQPRHIQEIVVFSVLLLSYVVAYLGVGLLAVRMLRKVARAGVALAPLVHILLLLIGCGVPAIIHMLTPSLRPLDYELLQAPDPFWSLAYLVDRGSLPNEGYWLLIIVPTTALIVFLLNLRGVAHEVRQVRVVKPKRVAEEDAERAAVKSPPPEPARASPWD